MTKEAKTPFHVTKEMQLKELNERAPPILNVDVVVFRREEKTGRVLFLIGQRNLAHRPTELMQRHRWIFPGGRMKFTETPQDAANRILAKELPGVRANLKKLAGAISDIGYDYRANGVTLYYLFEYASGAPKTNDQFSGFMWGSSDTLKGKDDVYFHDISILNEMEAAVRTMNTTEDEMIVEVNKNNKEIGTIVKRVAHSDPSHYHRAAHLIIFNSKGEVILHQRSFNKSTGAGKWDMFGGHQAAGMTIEQTAYQELMEELGISTQLTLHRVWLFKGENQSEWEYVYYGVSDGPYGFDRNEVVQLRSFDCEKLLKGEYDKKYEFVEPFAKKYVKELRFVWEKLKS
ncbi:MAG: NUDIX domain-containing protein [Candidatus Woesearchaeota archaeon]